MATPPPSPIVSRRVVLSAAPASERIVCLDVARDRRAAGFQSCLCPLRGSDSVVPVMSAARPLFPPKADVHLRSCYVAFVPIVFSNSGFRCQALRDHPCRAHCSLRGRGRHGSSSSSEDRSGCFPLVAAPVISPRRMQTIKVVRMHIL